MSLNIKNTAIPNDQLSVKTIKLQQFKHGIMPIFDNVFNYETLMNNHEKQIKNYFQIKETPGSQLFNS